MTSAQPYTEFDPVSHRYYVDGRWFPSVTQILGRAGLISDFATRSEQARWRGSAVHQLLAAEDENGKPLDLRRVHGELRNYLRAWRDYKHRANLEVKLTEERVVSTIYGFAGTMDRMVEFFDFDGTSELCIVDLKTNKTGAIPKWTRYQLAAYGLGFQLNRAFGRRAVCLKPDGTYNVVSYPISDYAADCAEFLRLLEKVKNADKE